MPSDSADSAIGRLSFDSGIGRLRYLTYCLTINLLFSIPLRVTLERVTAVDIGSIVTFYFCLGIYSTLMAKAVSERLKNIGGSALEEGGLVWFFISLGLGYLSCQAVLNQDLMTGIAAQSLALIIGVPVNLYLLLKPGRMNLRITRSDPPDQKEVPLLIHEQELERQKIGRKL